MFVAVYKTSTRQVVEFVDLLGNKNNQSNKIIEDMKK